MSSKKRRFEQLQAAAAAAPTEKAKYVDPFQQQVVPKIEEVGKKLEGKGKTILYAVVAVIILTIVVMFIMSRSRTTSGAAQAALGKAIETSQARVSDIPAAAGTTDKVFKTEKERSEAAIAEFQAVIDKFGGSVGEKAKYFIAVNRLNIDRAAGIAELEAIANTTSDTGKLAKFALAQTRADDNKLDEAVAIYQELIALSDPLIAKETLNFNLAKIYEKQGKKQEAADLYFNIAKAASEAKDLDGKPVRLSDTATESKEKLKAIDPERAKQIPEPTPDSPFGGGGIPPISISQ